MSKTKIWITGAKGQLGTAIYNQLDYHKYTVVTTDIDLDITDYDEVASYMKVTKPNVVINCAGMTDLKTCEENMIDAYKVNAIGPRNLAAATRSANAKFIQISTDDVFNGKNRDALNEFDVVSPITVYGKSKLAGETFVRELNPKHIIIRSSWIYGDGKHNFVSVLLNQAKTRTNIQLPSDQFSTPTSATELAKFIIHLLETKEYGTYHASCEGFCSRYEFGVEILRLAGIENVTLEPVLSNSTTIEGRGRYTILDNLMMKLTDNYEMPAWKDALSDYMKTINK
ncbi:MAG: dTDP-4-dehydrorhamnose reductase [Lachnospiraceae bacterium]|nr:dTDP-4-dehydrorhamnose reductase [Lachnospiraceae bacterium]